MSLYANLQGAIVLWELRIIYQRCSSESSEFQNNDFAAQLILI